MGNLKPADDGLTQQFAIWRDIVGGVSSLLRSYTNEVAKYIYLIDPNDEQSSSAPVIPITFLFMARTNSYGRTTRS